MSLPARSAISKGPMGIPNLRSTESTWRGRAPSSRRNAAWTEYGFSTRFPTKPSQLPTTTPTLPIALVRDSTVANARCPVSAPRTTSTSFMRCAGEKKCMPRTLALRLCPAADAILSTSNVDVLVQRMASGDKMEARERNTFCFRSSRSKTASTTKSHSERAARSVAKVRRCAITCSGDARPRRFLFASDVRARVTEARPRAKASSDWSTRMTCRFKPFAAKAALAIPLPMVPAPTTPTRRSSRGSSAVDSAGGRRPAALSAKKM
mmetsp:Transcript_16952/g.49394  ORF Transcript_16952/g.49394 Transcript_16952/m.49394 type:complete len:265 (+) Transcript_16952:776-1570(+)